jgi:DASS family divalent anion:Na+ symporter
MLAEQLNKLGVIGWAALSMKDAIVASGMGWFPTAGVLLLAFVFSHYLFASTTAHISAMLFAFMSVGAQLLPAGYLVPFLLMMTAGSAIMMTLTHYATGTSPIIFGSGYVTMGNWWRVGFVMCVLELAIFAVIGGAWWKVLGFW